MIQTPHEKVNVLDQPVWQRSIPFSSLEYKLFVFCQRLKAGHPFLTVHLRPSDVEGNLHVKLTVHNYVQAQNLNK